MALHMNSVFPLNVLRIYLHANILSLLRVFVAEYEKNGFKYAFVETTVWWSDHYPVPWNILFQMFQWLVMRMVCVARYTEITYHIASDFVMSRMYLSQNFSTLKCSIFGNGIADDNDRYHFFHSKCAFKNAQSKVTLYFSGTMASQPHINCILCDLCRVLHTHNRRCRPHSRRS